MMLVKILVMVLTFCNVNSSTHWVVTEDGRIQQQLESPFAMKQPDDLVSFMRQERTYTYLKQTKEKLLNEQSEIDSNEDKDMELESRHYEQDADCIAAGQKLLDFDLFITSVLPFEHKDVKVSDHIDIVKVPPGEVQQPNCTTAHDLPFSVHAYDHLEGIQNRHLFPHHAVSGLKATMSFLESPDDAATAISEALNKNSSSWVLYDLAGFYWRMKGDSTEAVECLRRALHFSPEKYKDIALVNLANILHRAHYTMNATVLMHHALKISNDFSINFFTLANMYAALGEYNESIYYFEQTLKRQVDFETAKKKLAAVKCQLKLQEKLENQHLSLQRTLQELQKYKVKHEQFLEEQKRFTDLHLSKTMLTDQHMIYEHQRMKEGTFNRKCELRNGKSGSVLVCNLPTPDSPSSVSKEDEEQILFEQEPIPIPMTSKRSAKENNVFRRPKPKRKPDKNANATKNRKSDGEGGRPGTVEHKYDPVYDWNNPNWPSAQSCEDYADHYRAWDDFPSAYVDPETRGFKVRELLTSYIGIEKGEMHGLPWNKPDCADLESIETTPYDHIVKLDSSAPLFKQDIFLQNFLLMHVNAGRVWPDDLAQRILSALQKSLQNKDASNMWVLYNLAGLFWRVNGDNAKAIQCLRRSVYRAPMQHADIPLVSMSNVMYRMGKLKDAVHLLIYALKVNNSEPATYLSMGNALQAQDNITGAVEFYKYGLVLHPQFQEAFHSLLIVKCHNLTDSGKEKSSEEILSNWNTQRLTEESASNDNEVSSDNTNTSDKEEENDSQEDLASPWEADDAISKLLLEKFDADKLLLRSGDILNDLRNTSSGDLDSKMVTARELMAKLSKMQSSLKQLVKEATSALSDESDEGFLSCEDPIIANLDFRFVSNTSCLNRLKLAKAKETTVKKPGGLAPECSATSIKNHRNIPSIESIPEDGPKETAFVEVLGKKLQTKDLRNALRSRLHSFPASWDLCFAASYFWRISGDSKKAVACLLVSLNNAPDENSSYCSLYSLADYLAVLSDFHNAADVAHLLGDTHDTVEVHYLLGNIFASNGDYKFAAEHYKRALLLDSGFADVLLRFKAASCREK